MTQFILLCIVADRLGVTDPENAWVALSWVWRAWHIVLG